MTHFLMATITPPDGTTESEPVTVLRWPDAIEFVLDDGTRLVFSLSELQAAMAADSERSAA